MTTAALRRLLQVSVFALCLPVVAGAQQARIGLYWDPNGGSCHLAADGDATNAAFVVVTKTFPFQRLDLVAHVPAGVTWLYDTHTADWSTVGDSQSGIEISPALSPCTSSVPANLLTIWYVAPSSLPPTSWIITGWPRPIVWGCSSSGTGYATSNTAWFNNPGANCSNYQYLAPYSPSPANGSDSAPTNSWLGFQGDANHIWLSTTPFTTPRDQDLVCVTAGGGSCPNPFNPGLLAPHTTYYWMAGNVCDPPSSECENALSDVWSFTTGDQPLAVQSSTWGAIKSLYR